MPRGFLFQSFAQFPLLPQKKQKDQVDQKYDKNKDANIHFDRRFQDVYDDKKFHFL